MKNFLMIQNSPGDYVKDIAENIIKKHKNLDFEKYDKISEINIINESLSL